MRIISDFKDYYDCIQSYGQDDLVFIRNRSNTIKPDRKFLVGINDSIVMSQRAVGFCGKLHWTIGCHNVNDLTSEWFYTIEDIDNWMDTSCKDKARRNYYFSDKTVYRRLSNRRYWHQNTIHRTDIVNFIKKFNETVAANQVEIAGLFSFEVPYFALRYNSYVDHVMIKNPLLKDYDFFRVFDTYRCFQELQMWLSNQAKPFKPIPHIDDKTMAEAKGFDKFSFRKTKS